MQGSIMKILCPDPNPEQPNSDPDLEIAIPTTIKSKDDFGQVYFRS